MSRSEHLRNDPVYQAIFEGNTAIKLLIDPGPGEDAGRILDANAAAAEFYGWSRDELRAMRIMQINTMTPAEIESELNAARTGKRNYFRFRHRTARGDIRSVEVHSSPIAVEGGTVLMSIVHDVTDRDRLEEHLERSQRLEAIGQLAGGVAHDFNNLLTVVVSAARLARMRLPEDHDSVRFLDEVQGAAARGAELTRQLLAFSRRQVMTPGAVAVDRVIAELVPLLERSLGSAHEIRVEIGEVPPVIADPAQLEQVVMNLVLNARDAMPDGGAITVAISPSVGTRDVPPGEWVAVAVRDDGIGMDAATRARVFEPFFTTKAEGTGMGLATVYGIVTQTGGHVTVESEPGAGSTFTLYLPVAGTPAPRHTRAPSPTVVEGHARILLVDDLAAVRAAVGDLLRDLGHTVLDAGSYDEALMVAGDRLDELDVLITDVVMPGRSGIELVRDLRALRPDLACIVVSGDLREQMIAELPRGVVRLAKPFSLAQLQDALAAVHPPRL
jgi:two-component system cell cycle sensor histidine kinase/response regulator CckA